MYPVLYNENRADCGWYDSSRSAVSTRWMERKEKVWRFAEKIKDAGFDLNKICLQEVRDEELEKIAGGFEFDQALVSCTCGNDNRDDFSWQFIASRLSTYSRPRDIFRCKKCNIYVYVYSDIICYHDELD